MYNCSHTLSFYFLLLVSFDLLRIITVLNRLYTPFILVTWIIDNTRTPETINLNASYKLTPSLYAMMSYDNILILILWGLEWNSDLKGRELKYPYPPRTESCYLLVFVRGTILEWHITTQWVLGVRMNYGERVSPRAKLTNVSTERILALNL